MSTIYKLGPNHDHTVQLDVDLMACRVRLSVDGHLELDKQVLDRLVYAFRLSASQKIPVRLIAELSGWRIEAGLFVGAKQVAPVNGQLAAINVPTDPDAENEPIGAGSEDAAPPGPPTAKAVAGPDELPAVTATEDAPAPEAPPAAADDGLRAAAADELPILGSEARGGGPLTPPAPTPAVSNPLAGPTVADGTAPARPYVGQRQRTDLTNPGIYACMVMAILNLAALVLTHVTGVVRSDFSQVQDWMVIAVAGSGLTFLLLAFGIALRSLVAAYFSITLTICHLVGMLTAIVWLSVLMNQQGGKLEISPLLLLGALLIRDTVCLVLFSRGIVRLRRWWI